MRKGAVPNIVQENSQLAGFILFMADFMALAAEVIECNTHQVHRTHGVMKTSVECPRVHKIRKAKLLDSAKALEVRVFDYVEYQFAVYGDETINRVVKNFLLIHAGIFYLVKPKSAENKFAEV